MGWSHSVYIAQAIHLYILDRCGPSVGLMPADRIITDASSYRCIDRVLHSVYIDDNVLIGPDPEKIKAVMNAVTNVYASHGLPVKSSKTVLPSADGVEVLGFELHGRLGTLGLSPTKIERLVAVTSQVLNYGFCSGHHLSILIGHWTWACLCRREALSVFQSVYRFIETAKTRIFEIWPSVRRELVAISSLAPLLFASLHSEWNQTVTATDASSTGMGITAVTSPPDQQLRSLLSSSAIQWSQNIVTAEAQLLVPTALRRVLCSTWSTIVSSPWRFQQHINALECHSILVAIRWLLSSPHSVNTRAVILSDSQVSVHALSKGRTSAPSIISVLRRISALCLASGLRVSYVWIPSLLNPADEPSRRH